MPVSVVFIRGLLAELEIRNLPSAPLLTRLALDRESLADLRTRIPDADFEAVVTQISAQLRDDALGLTIAERAPEHTLQLLSSLVLSCETLRDALATLTCYAALLADDLVFTFEESDESARFSFSFARAGLPGKRFIADYCIVMIARLIRHVVGDAPGAMREVSLQHPEPEQPTSPMPASFLSPRFGAADNAIVFAPSALTLKPLYADPRAHLEYRDAADNVLAEVQRVVSVADRVRNVLRARTMLARPSMKQVSTVIGVQPRTLARSLSAEGHSFRVLVDEARRIESCEALKHRVPIAEIAESVGFSEPSAFHRAFRRWTGQTPSQYARATGGGGEL